MRSTGRNETSCLNFSLVPRCRKHAGWGKPITYSWHMSSTNSDDLMYPGGRFPLKLPSKPERTIGCDSAVGLSETPSNIWSDCSVTFFVILAVAGGVAVPISLRYWELLPYDHLYELLFVIVLGRDWLFCPVSLLRRKMYFQFAEINNLFFLCRKFVRYIPHESLPQCVFHWILLKKYLFREGAVYKYEVAFSLQEEGCFTRLSVCLLLFELSFKS